MNVPIATSVLTGSVDWPAWLGSACVIATLVPSGSRWLRVAQREHYLAGASSRFAARWWSCRPGNILLFGVGAIGVGLAIHWPIAVLLTAGVVAVGPLGLGVRGRTGPLVATRRLRWLAVCWAAVEAAVIALGALTGAPAPVAGAAALLAPLAIDLAALLLEPVEYRAGQQFVSAAAHRLESVAPTVVGVTGSYGKTSTKNHIAHLLGGSRRTVASPASFNNRSGLARAINEQLVNGTEIFVAEMGTYGAGEIADMCRWCPPDIAVITAIGPVHLERFGSEAAIVAAKSEILAGAHTAVLNVDNPHLARLADSLNGRPGGPAVVGCSIFDETSELCVKPLDGVLTLWVGGRCVATSIPQPQGAHPSNLACAAAVALELGVPEDIVARRLGSVPNVANRLSASPAGSGVLVLDDTYNSNPAGARAALDRLAVLGAAGRRVVVTPGMVELGGVQESENRSFAECAGRVATDLIVVGRTNRVPLLEGAKRTGVESRLVATREEAVAWVRAHLGHGDAVLYENDLPDHYP